MQTCKIILATSLIWFLIDVILLLYYTDCRGADCAGAKGEDGRGPSADAFVHHSSDNHQDVNLNHNKNEVGDEGEEEGEGKASGVSTHITRTETSKICMYVSLTDFSRCSSRCLPYIQQISCTSGSPHRRSRNRRARSQASWGGP